MKTIGALLFLSVLLPVASIVTLGQSRHLSASESKSYIKLAKEKLSRVPHRERASVLNYSEIGSQPVEISTYTIDYKRLNLFRSVLLSRNGNQTIREELIRDGDNQYLRIGNEKWKKVSPGESAGAGSGVGIGAGVSDEIAVDCEFVGKETVNQVFSARYKRASVAT